MSAKSSNVENNDPDHIHSETPMSDDEDAIVNIDNFSGPFQTWIKNLHVKNEVSRLFRRFLKLFQDGNGNAVYMQRIRRMCRENSASLVVSYRHLGRSAQNVAIWLADYPSAMLPLLNAAALQVAEEVFPHYSRIRGEVFVRVSDLPIEDRLRELRQMHLGRLIRVFGVITKRTSIFPQLKSGRFNCIKCNYLSPAYTSAPHSSEMRPPDRCRECGSKGPFRVNPDETVYRNFQRLTLQESPGRVPAGRMPRRKEVVVTDDLIDAVRPGEEVGVTGIYKNQFETALNTKNGFPVFATVIEGNHLQRVREQFEANMTDEDKKLIREYSKKSNIYDIIVNSIAPSIHGHKGTKEAITLALFGGTAKEIDGGRHRLRGDINVLILGDPGTAKSQFLKYVEKAAPRAVYSTGKGASAVGLTATVQKDPKTREWTLEGGALVLADQGVCLIDEFDKMNDHDRTSIHEAMEQQTISISKAGIVATLQARCSVMAVANPRKERYDSSATFLENVDLSDAIISRFDVVRVVKDTVDSIEDEKLAFFVVNSHDKSHPQNRRKASDKEAEAPPAPPPEGEALQQTMPQDLLKKYIAYARATVRPKINNIDQHKVVKVYTELRRESMKEGALPIGTRHIESIIRMAEARAKLHLRGYVSNTDVDVAIAVAVSSFVETQKFSVMRAMRKRFRRFVRGTSDCGELLSHVLAELFRDEQHFKAFLSQRGGGGEGEPLEVDSKEFEEKAKRLEVFDLEEFYHSRLFLGTFEFDRAAGKIRQLVGDALL